MSRETTYDLVIVGGGLAGLSCAILMARKNYAVLVLEKDSYPRHKVCGEYMSMESRHFLENLGLSVVDLKLPMIGKLLVTDTNGNRVEAALPQGGFGISRYLLDNTLSGIAVREGVDLLTNARVDHVKFEGDSFRIYTGQQEYKSKLVCGCWGKRSNIDVKWNRKFISTPKQPLANYIGIKYHVKYNWDLQTIGLHNFTNGYCGISRIEDDKCCLCYLTTADLLQKHKNDIHKMEQETLMKNPWLKDIFSGAEFLFDAPLTISQVCFNNREQVYEHVLLMGDAAGVITPLCGNGMSMALHAAKLAAAPMHDFLEGKISREMMEKVYVSRWKNTFSGRLRLGRFVQGNFGKDATTSFFLKTMHAIPWLKNKVVANAAGPEF